MYSFSDEKKPFSVLLAFNDTVSSSGKETRLYSLQSFSETNSDRVSVFVTAAARTTVSLGIVPSTRRDSCRSSRRQTPFFQALAPSPRRRSPVPVTRSFIYCCHRRDRCAVLFGCRGTRNRANIAAENSSATRASQKTNDRRRRRPENRLNISQTRRRNYIIITIKTMFSYARIPQDPPFFLFS